MKQLKQLVFALILSFGLSATLSAQGKIAHISTEDLIQAMPEFKTAQNELKTLGETYQGDIEKSIKELETKLKQYDQEAPSQTDDVNKERMKEVEGMKQSLAQFQQQAQKELSDKELTLLKPITEKAKAAIEKVAAAQGYQYVLESRGLIVAKGKDLMADVKAELGI